MSVLLGYSNGSFEDQIRISTGSTPQSVAVGDFNNDTRLDIVVGNSGSNDMSIFLGYDNGSFANQMKFSAGTMPWSLAVGDFNNDTTLDIVVTNYQSSGVGVLLRYLKMEFLQQSTLTAGNGSQPRSFVIGDFNNDYRMDVIVASSGSSSIAIFLGCGNYSFADPTQYSTGSRPISIATGDFNNDNRLDVVVANLLCGCGCVHEEEIFPPTHTHTLLFIKPL
ncbi:unnamed protein product [Rotaria socialis]|uniref:VCBS repeat-containing protein n=1 Tax=Rotaria socialis TaxID=392032 RepID=A0A820MY87_9BILA|nr:unnamed protein product [Rotaria socialis]CAF3332544.1 unnamed protein product [Rotaria socialis]CAF3674845.1 unnamed protein product [Rotaria socialis]CAF4168885.1 unnamed protein product [Rotaria socialis]CAF4228961.1 unnamed protein product [Rotaria socialis]